MLLWRTVLLLLRRTVWRRTILWLLRRAVLRSAVLLLRSRTVLLLRRRPVRIRIGVIGIVVRSCICVGIIRIAAVIAAVPRVTKS